MYDPVRLAKEALEKKKEEDFPSRTNSAAFHAGKLCAAGAEKSQRFDAQTGYFWQFVGGTLHLNGDFIAPRLASLQLRTRALRRKQNPMKFNSC